MKKARGEELPVPHKTTHHTNMMGDIIKGGFPNTIIIFYLNVDEMSNLVKHNKIVPMKSLFDSLTYFFTYFHVIDKSDVL